MPQEIFQKFPVAFVFIANSIKTTPQLHLNSTFVVYHKGVPGRRGQHRSGKRPEKTTLGGTQVNPLVLRQGNEVAVR